MNAFPAGTRVFIWNATGEIVYATVLDSERLSDGTQMLKLRTDDARVLRLPAAGVSHVQQ